MALININNIFVNGFQLDSNNFPMKEDLKNLFHEINFNRVLEIIKNKMHLANIEGLNYIRILNSDVVNISQVIIDEVKNCMRQRLYTITNIEDVQSNFIGWKLEWI
jgi:hypothetical protein